MPTQIDAFITQFFGAVGKSNVGGNVTWSLPCGLDLGIAANPRQSGENLGCYFLRLMADGLHGTCGDAGPDGANGAPGFNAFTTTLQNFSQPSIAEPYISIKLAPSAAAFVEGLFIAIEGSGIYRISNLASDGTALLQLFTATQTAGVLIPEGSLVIPSGYPGTAVVGPKGDTGNQGPQGPQGSQGSKGAPGGQGPQGNAVTLPSGMSIAHPSASYPLSSTYAGNALTTYPAFTAPSTDAATYFVLAAYNLFYSLTTASPSGAGKLFVKIKKFDGGSEVGDVSGTERAVGNDTALALPSGSVGLGRLVVIPFFAVNNTGEHGIWYPYFKSTITGDYNSFYTTAHSMLAWFKL